MQRLRMSPLDKFKLGLKSQSSKKTYQDKLNHLFKLLGISGLPWRRGVRALSSLERDTGLNGLGTYYLITLQRKWSE